MQVVVARRLTLEVLPFVQNPGAAPWNLQTFAEEEGFEPPVPCKQNNGFQDRRIRPLCHSSSAPQKYTFFSGLQKLKTELMPQRHKGTKI